MVAVMRELFEPYPLFHQPERWLLLGERGRQLIEAWERVCRDVLRSGDAAQLHSARDDYHAVLVGYIKILDGYQLLVERLGHRQVFLFPPHSVQEGVQETRAEIQAHYDSLFPRWQTLDDLEGILLERITPTNAELKELAKKYPPPPSWYEETENPFAPEGSR